jgi:hypothetical protein
MLATIGMNIGAGQFARVRRIARTVACVAAINAWPWGPHSRGQALNERTRQRERIVVGISGATGVIHGIGAPQIVCELDIENHLVVSRAGEMMRAYNS